MNFLVDAQLPRRLAHRLRDAGHDALHTLDLPKGNRTTDTEINEISAREHRVVITKDADFVSSFLLERTPYKLLLISTGNIANADLEALFVPLISALATAFDTSCATGLTPFWPTKANEPNRRSRPSARMPMPMIGGPVRESYHNGRSSHAGVIQYACD